MSEGRYDSLVDFAAGAVMAGAVGFCLFTGWMPGQAGMAGGGSLLAFLGTFGVMRKMSPQPIELDEVEIIEDAPALDFAPEKEEDPAVPAPFEPEAEEELAADAEEEILPPPPLPDEGELVLDDIVAELEPQSRVVRLFAPEQHEVDPAALKARVDRHLAGEEAAEDERELLASKPEFIDEEVAATNRLAAALDRVRQRLD